MYVFYVFVKEKSGDYSCVHLFLDFIPLSFSFPKHLSILLFQPSLICCGTQSLKCIFKNVLCCHMLLFYLLPWLSLPLELPYEDKPMSFYCCIHGTYHMKTFNTSMECKWICGLYTHRKSSSYYAESCFSHEGLTDSMLVVTSKN